MELLIVTGMSGAGKSQAANVLEDIGFYCVDNIPPAIIPSFVELSARSGDLLNKMAIVTDMRGGILFNEIEEKMQDYICRRKSKQPLEYPSAGSFFKRPAGYFAGALIEKNGLKGTTEGGAQVSEKHAGFIINRGGATCEDVKRLSRRVSDTVLAYDGVKLEREVIFVGREEN